MKELQEKVKNMSPEERENALEQTLEFYSMQKMGDFPPPVSPVEEVVDPTGAGDTFAGGLMGYLSQKKQINSNILKEAAVYATILSSFNVEGFGVSKTAGLTVSDLNKRVKEFKKFISPV